MNEDHTSTSMMKSCTVCHQELPLTEFWKDRSRRDGLNPRCKTCHSADGKTRKEYQATYRDLNRDTRNAYYRQYAKTARGKVVKYKKDSKRRAAKLRLPFVPYDPVAIYEREGGVCSLCVEPVEKFEETNEGTVRAFHIDHVVPLQVDNELLLSYGIQQHPGDVPWNVTIAHPSCNSSKGNRMTQEDADNYFQLRAMYKE